MSSNSNTAPLSPAPPSPTTKSGKSGVPRRERRGKALNDGAKNTAALSNSTATPGDGKEKVRQAGVLEGFGNGWKRKSVDYPWNGGRLIGAVKLKDCCV